VNYRREVDGLRALAVLPVILFHAGSNWFAGGFVGVDVFFVISGYLITSLLIAEKEKGTFSLLRFYERRARRILPALLLVSVACVVLAWPLLSPAPMKSLSESLAAVASFSSNILFWRRSGYFDTANELKPLVHTWSLGVEEQYYLLFPLLIMLAWRFGRRRLGGLLAGLGLLSLALSQWGALHAPTAAFYLLPTRAWELFLGGLLALHQSRSGRPAHRSGPPGRALGRWADLLGILLIGWAVVVFDRHTPFPGVNALVPTLGTALVILFATPGTVTGRVLGHPVLVGIGLISYGAYLWHQPLLAFARLGGGFVPGPAALLLLGATSFGLAYLTWRFVERPCRDPRRVSARAIVRLGAVGTALVGAIGVAGVLAGGFPGRFPELARVSRAFTGMLGRTGPVLRCYGRPRHPAQTELCGIPSGPPGTGFVAAGDSHLLTLHEGFEEGARRRGLRGAWISAEACLPLLEVFVLRSGTGDLACAELNRRVHDYVKANRVPILYLVARWTLYANGDRILSASPEGGGARSMEASRTLLASGLARTVAAYAAVGTRVVFVLQAPEQTRDPESIYGDVASKRGPEEQEALHALSVSLPQHQRDQAFVRGMLDRYRMDPRLRVLSLDEAFCDESRCLVGEETRSYYSDANHLSPDGALRTAQLIARTLPDPSRRLP